MAVNMSTSTFYLKASTMCCLYGCMHGCMVLNEYFGQYGDEAFYNRTFDFISRQAKNKNRDPFFIYHSFREDFKPSPVLLSFVAVLFVLSIFQTL
eukprot:m.174764 g.174764  ORF g.174764 m.174764 type:complete len:95 (-) comp13510_c0_seq3:2744-3028(-)